MLHDIDDDIDLSVKDLWSKDRMTVVLVNSMLYSFGVTLHLESSRSVYIYIRTTRGHDELLPCFPILYPPFC